MADIGLYIACILDVQALVVKYDDSITMDWLEFQHGELSHLLPAEVVSGDDATKENVIERVTSGSASLVHFLVHGTAGGRADRHRRKKRRVGREREENTKGCVSLFCSLFHFFLGGEEFYHKYHCYYRFSFFFPPKGVEITASLCYPRDDE